MLSAIILPALTLVTSSRAETGTENMASVPMAHSKFTHSSFPFRSEINTAPDGGEIVYVPAGEFLMGSLFKDPLAYPDEHPLHTVNLNSFWIHKTEVTNAMYQECIQDGPCTEPWIEEVGPFKSPQFYDQPFAHHPVVNVNWHQAATYCEWAGGRLPSEAEWEKAARGVDSLQYPRGAERPNCDLTNFFGCTQGTEEVGSHERGKSPAGVLDMAGNVREWVWDYYVENYYGASPSHNPPGPEEGISKVVRGGSYNDDFRGIRTTTRYPFRPEDIRNDIGFRCTVLEKAPYCPLSYNPQFQPSSRSCGPANFGASRISLEFTCIGLSVRQLTLNLGQTVTGLESVFVDEYGYNCHTNPNYPDRLFCKGPSARQGQNAQVTVCSGGDYSPYCSQGLYYDAETHTCTPTSISGNPLTCASGYLYNSCYALE